MSEGISLDELGDYSDYIDQDFIEEQQEKEPLYLAEYDKVKDRKQKKAFMKEKHRQAMAAKLGMKPDTLRKKLKHIVDTLTSDKYEKKEGDALES